MAGVEAVGVSVEFQMEVEGGDGDGRRCDQSGTVCHAVIHSTYTVISKYFSIKLTSAGIYEAFWGLLNCIFSLFYAESCAAREQHR